jgi:hypothetical protein
MTFKQGQVVVFDGSNLRLSHEDKIEYYSCLGYNQYKKPLFIFMTEILDYDGTDTGHCVLLNMDTWKIEGMRHTADFRLATTEEF